MTSLRHVEEVLAELTDIELRALIIASKEGPQIAPGLLVWIEGACNWELNRRRVGRYRNLLPPTIGLSDAGVSIEGWHAMRESFSAGPFATAALKFLDALALLLPGGENKH